jgi:putative salt-induced outer membrane protein YdiY
VVILCLISWFLRGAEPVVLQLRNGDRLTGVVLLEDTNRLTLKTTWNNIVVVPVAEVTARAAIAAPPVVTPPPSSVTVPPPPVTGAPGTSATPKPPWQLAGEAQLGMDLLFSQKSRQLVSGRLKLTYGRDRLLNNLDYMFWYGRTEGILSDNRMFGSLKTDYDLTRRFFVYNLGGAGYDAIRKINLRYEEGPGVGYHLVKRANMVLDVELGGNYQAEFLADRSEIESFYVRCAENLTWQILPRLALDEKVEYFPNVQRWGAYRLRAESNLNYALLDHLALVLTVLDEYDTETAAGVGQNDLQVRSSVSVKF